MRALKTGTKAWLLGYTLLFSCPFVAGHVEAAPHQNSTRPLIKPDASFRAYPISTRLTFGPAGRTSQGVALSHPMLMSRSIRGTTRRLAARSNGISCVPYARQVSGIMVTGNAWQWWQNAQGLYARGNRPEPGSVLNFRANGRMRLGHVAVVTQVVNPRQVIVDHANWPGAAARGGVSHGVTVVDVSEANNWSAVRVELGRGGQFGSVYPTYGFIYNRPDTGVVIADISRPAPQPVINQVPSDLRPVAERPWHTTIEEVAEAPATTPRRIDLSINSTLQGR
ncbi:MAG TPA: CHAP domain-containing protein [Rhodopila sp.]